MHLARPARQLCWGSWLHLGPRLHPRNIVCEHLSGALSLALALAPMAHLALGAQQPRAIVLPLAPPPSCPPYMVFALASSPLPLLPPPSLSFSRCAITFIVIIIIILIVLNILIRLK